jgi:predicted component of type VI protein secretion system
MRKVIGRSEECDFVILDPQRRVSRKHATVEANAGQFYITDYSSNGTFINEKRIVSNTPTKISPNDKITLSNSYILNLNKVFELDSDSTRVFQNSQQSSNDVADDERTIVFEDKGKRIEFHADKTSIGDLSNVDNTQFKSVGRDSSCSITIADSFVSKQHCKMRLLSPLIIEIVDLGSSNGTFADGKKLSPNETYRFSTNVELKLGTRHTFDIKTSFPSAQIIPKAQQKSPTFPTNAEITVAEKLQFNEMKKLWDDYQSRNTKANNVLSAYGIGGAALGLVAAALAPPLGVGGLLIASGGGLLGRFLGQQKSNEIRQDLTYEEMFLQTYACPRCQESFQKRPWITIRECIRCKIKFK